MSKIVYGVFDSTTKAERALARLGRGPTVGDVSAMAYDHEPSGEELSLAATRTLRWTVAAMVLVGFLGAVAMSFIAPLIMGYDFALADFFSIWGAGFTFGMVAGAVSGMAEPVKALDKPMALARAGKSVVLMSDSGEAEVEVLREEGAELAQVA